MYKLFATADGGCNWIQEGGLLLKSVVNYQVCNEDQYYFIDSNGNVYQKADSHE